MANPNALVDGVRELSPLSARLAQPLQQTVTVNFEGGKSAYLDMTIPRSKVWAEVLNNIRETNRKAYVEIDPASNLITQLLCPLPVKIGAITPIGKEGDAEVELIISHARHYLRRKNPDFQELLKMLQAAKKQKKEVLVTETLDDHEIIDVKPLSKPQARKRK